MWGRIPVPYREHVLTPSSGQEGVGCPQCCEGSRWMTPAGGRRGQPKTRGCWEGCLRQVRTAGHYGKWRLQQLLPDPGVWNSCSHSRAVAGLVCPGVSVSGWQVGGTYSRMFSDVSQKRVFKSHFSLRRFFFHIQYIKFCFQQGHKKAEKCVTSF